LPALLVALDLVSWPESRLLFPNGSQLPALAQCLDVARRVGDRRRIGRSAVDRLYTAACIERDR